MADCINGEKLMDELVKRLREAFNVKYGKRVNIDRELLKQAADAIEELSKQILEMGQVGKFLLDVHKINSKMVSPESVPSDSEWWSQYKALLEALYLPRWIPVTERLPDDRRDVQITVFWHDAWRTMYGYYDGAYWHLYAPMHTEVADVYVIGWMEKPTPMPLPQPQKDE